MSAGRAVRVKRGRLSVSTTKRVPPETVRQAEEWQRRKNAYYGVLGCHACASKLAYAHRDGWSTVEGPPCSPRCAAIVAGFPESTCHPEWRKWPRGRVGGALARSSAGQGASGTAGAPTGDSADYGEAA